MPKIIRDGKLCLVAELIGGPADGTIVISDLDVIKIVKRKPITPMLSSSIPDISDIDYYRYIKVTNEKYVFEELLSDS